MATGATGCGSVVAVGIAGGHHLDTGAHGAFDEPGGGPDHNR